MSESAREGRGDVAVPSSFAVVLSLPDHVARVEQCHLTEDNGPSPFLDLPVSLGQCKAELQNSFYSAAVLVTALVFRLTVLALFLVRDTFHARVVLVEQYSLIRDPEASRHLDSSSWLDQYTAALFNPFYAATFRVMALVLVEVLAFEFLPFLSFLFLWFVHLHTRWKID